MKRSPQACPSTAHSSACRERETTWSWGTQPQHQAEEGNGHCWFQCKKGIPKCILLITNRGTRLHPECLPLSLPGLYSVRGNRLQHLLTHKLFTRSMFTHICAYANTHIHLIYTLLRMKVNGYDRLQAFCAE